MIPCAVMAYRLTTAGPKVPLIAQMLLHRRRAVPYSVGSSFTGKTALCSLAWVISWTSAATVCASLMPSRMAKAVVFHIGIGRDRSTVYPMQVHIATLRSLDIAMVCTNTA